MCNSAGSVVGPALSAAGLDVSGLKQRLEARGRVSGEINRFVVRVEKGQAVAGSERDGAAREIVYSATVRIIGETRPGRDYSQG